MGPDPLADTLFRPTASLPSLVAPASALPVRVAGTRSRAGNAMSRTRAALLDGARIAVAAGGTRITMAEVASAAGVAKATLYNHFRTREAVLGALLLDEIERLVAGATARPFAEALEVTAQSIAANPVLRGLAAVEPAALAALARIDLTAPGWRLAHDAVVTALGTTTGVDTVLRVLASYVVSPAGPAAVAADVALLMAGIAPENVASAVPEPV